MLDLASLTCLCIAVYDYSGSLGVVAGWGRTTEKGDPSDYLKEIQVILQDGCNVPRPEGYSPARKGGYLLICCRFQ